MPGLCPTLLALLSWQENIRRNFGMPQPNGYRKAMRFMRHANKFGLPIVTLVDTPGAYAGRAAEELGQVGGQVEEQGHVGGDWGRVDGAEELADVLGQAGDAAVASSRAQQQW